MTKKIVILGAGESGAGAAVLAKKQGFDTFVSDMSPIKEKYKMMLIEKGIEWEEGKHTEELILTCNEESFKRNPENKLICITEEYNLDFNSDKL